MSNLLKDRYPELLKEWDYEKNNDNPLKISYGVTKKYWWRCTNKHSFDISVNARTNQNQNCPYCSGRRVGYGNDFKSNFPEIAKEWDYEKNDKFPEDYTVFSNVNVWWMCKKKHPFQAPIAKRSQGRGCPYCSNQKVGYGNDFKSNFPEIAKEWDDEKNSVAPDKVLPGTNRKFWWLCKKKHSWLASVANRTNKNKHSCPYCSNPPVKVGYGNDFKSNFPEIAKEWDDEKNSVAPDKVFPKSIKKYWWICTNKHSFHQSLGARTNQDQGCPQCSLVNRSKDELYLLFE
jgi:hypothetical protein